MSKWTMTIGNARCNIPYEIGFCCEDNSCFFPRYTTRYSTVARTFLEALETGNLKRIMYLLETGAIKEVTKCSN